MTQYTVTIEEDENGDSILPLPDDVVTQLGWKEGDTIAWSMVDGAIAMTKVDPPKTQLVMVETVSTFRHRYIVEVPGGEADWALDTVTMDEAEELSQQHLGEQIVSHRVVNKEEICTMFREDNKYLSSWTDDQILQSVINQTGVSK